MAHKTPIIGLLSMFPVGTIKQNDYEQMFTVIETAAIALEVVITLISFLFLVTVGIGHWPKKVLYYF